MTERNFLVLVDTESGKQVFINLDQIWRATWDKEDDGHYTITLDFAA
jgi:hypothetical protein